MIELPKRTRPAIDAQINIVPYIDVMLVLLVIFMLATLIIQQGIEVDLPSGTGEVENVDFSEQFPTIVTVNKEGEYFINPLNEENTELSQGEALPLVNLAATVKARMQLFPQMKVFVKGDKNVLYGKVIELMSILQDNTGIAKIGMVIESPDAK